MASSRVRGYPSYHIINVERVKDCNLEHMMSFWGIHLSSHFMHDGANRSKVGKKWLHDTHMSVFDWHGNSPDFNLYENAWNCMKSSGSPIY